MNTCITETKYILQSGLAQTNNVQHIGFRFTFRQTEATKNYLSCYIKTFALTFIPKWICMLSFLTAFPVHLNVGTPHTEDNTRCLSFA